MDNATSHAAKYSISFFAETEVQYIFNVANSPALNLIELVFADLKECMRSKNRKNQEELLRECIKFLNNIDENYIKSKIH